jgi:hypothetical protein
VASLPAASRCGLINTERFPTVIWDSAKLVYSILMLKENSMILKQVRFHLGRRALGAALVASMAMAGTVALSATAQAAETASSNFRPTSSVGHAAYRETIAVPAGAAVSVGPNGSLRISASRSEVAKPATITCTLTVYPPTFAEGEPYGEDIYATADIECTGVVSELQISVGIFQPYGPILASNSASASNTLQVNVVTVYPYSEGYYYSTAVGNVNGSSFTEVYSPDTFIDG